MSKPMDTITLNRLKGQTAILERYGPRVVENTVTLCKKCLYCSGLFGRPCLQRLLPVTYDGSDCPYYRDYREDLLGDVLKLTQLEQRSGSESS